MSNSKPEKPIPIDELARFFPHYESVSSGQSEERDPFGRAVVGKMYKRTPSNKAFPFPVLRRVGSPIDSDYPGYDFQATVFSSVTSNGLSIEIQVSFELRQPDILKLIEDGKAKYGCLVVSPTTLYRRMFMTKQPSIKHTFAPGEIDDVVEIRPCVVAVKDIQDYVSTDFNEEFEDDAFDIQAGSPMAQDQTIAFPATQEYLRPITSVFDIIPDTDQSKGRYDIRLDERVQLIMHPDDARLLVAARGNSDHQSSIMTSFYLPVVMHALSEIVRSSEDVSEDDAELWRRVFNFKLAEHDVSIEKLTDGQPTILQVAQQLLEDPLRHLPYMKETIES